MLIKYPLFGITIIFALIMSLLVYLLLGKNVFDKVKSSFDSLINDFGEI